MLRSTLFAVLLLLIATVAAATPSSAASLLPPGKQQFLDRQGAPLVAGNVFFYVPGTTTPKDTWQDSAATILNTNPVQLDSGGFAVIYGSGSYRMVVKDALGNTIYDQLTADTNVSNASWAGTASGTVNNLIVTASAFSVNDGQQISWRNASTNTGPSTVTILGVTYNIVKDTAQGIVPLSGGEMVATGISTVVYDASLGNMHLIAPLTTSPMVTLASAGTVDLGAAGSQNIRLTGTATITSFGSSANINSPLYFVLFTDNMTLTYNATSMVLPWRSHNLTTVFGASAVMRYLGSGNWQMLDYASPGTEPVKANTGTTYTVTFEDQGKRLSFANAAATTVSIQQAGGQFPNGFWFDVANNGAGMVTLLPATSTINGAASRILPPGRGVRIISDGTNWQIQGTDPVRSRVLLNTLSPSAAASVEDITSFTSSFPEYEIRIEDLVFSTATTNCRLQLRVSGVFQTTGYLASATHGNNASTATVNETTFIPCNDKIGNTVLYPGVTLTLRIANPAAGTGNKTITGFGAEVIDPFQSETLLVSGSWTTSGDAITGFKIIPVAGTITGVIKVYGLGE